jgi:hypothetical protein
MASTVEIDETNGAGATLTHAITGLAMGTTDAPNMTPGAAGARQPANSNGMQKALRVHLTALGGGGGITNLRIYCDPATTGWTLFTNCTTNATNYASSKITVYVQPTVGTGAVPYAVPTADPGTANLGIAGSLTGSLTATGSSDYCYLQLRASSAVTTSFSSPCYFAYDDIG